MLYEMSFGEICHIFGIQKYFSHLGEEGRKNYVEFHIPKIRLILKHFISLFHQA